MEEILKTTLLEFERSTFLIDLVQHQTGNLYIAIKQIVHLDNDIKESQTIKINPSIFEDFMETLINFQKDIPKHISQHAKNYLSNEKKSALKENYLKGVGIKDLALQFGCSAQIIEQILRNSGIEIVNVPLRQAKNSHFKKRR